ncbi:MAG: hypothetical protein OEW08_14040 [Gammaproteobacteria bacterium]|nr:hypothetical protein [Gammaproteobacteria bacterium]
MKIHKFAFCLTLSTTTLTACGLGDATSNGTPQRQGYVGLRAPVAIDERNAITVAQFVLNPGALGNSSALGLNTTKPTPGAATSQNTPVNVITVLLASLQLPATISSDAHAKALQASGLPINLPLTGKFESNCPNNANALGGTLTYTITPDETQTPSKTAFSAVYQFDHYCDDLSNPTQISTLDTTITGTAYVHTEFVNTRVKLVITLGGVTVDSATSTTALQGTYSIDTLESKTKFAEYNLTITDTERASNVQKSVMLDKFRKDLLFVNIHTNNGASPQTVFIGTAINGTLYINTLGRIDIHTHELNSIEIFGANNSKARLTLNNANSADYTIDVDADGNDQYELTGLSNLVQ